MLHLAGGGVLLPEVPARDVVLDALLGQQVHSDLPTKQYGYLRNEA